MTINHVAVAIRSMRELLDSKQRAVAAIHAEIAELRSSIAALEGSTGTKWPSPADATASISRAIQTGDASPPQAGDQRRKRGENAARVIELAKENPEAIWTATAIADQLGIPKSSAQVVLANEQLFEKVEYGQYRLKAI